MIARNPPLFAHYIPIQPGMLFPVKRCVEGNPPKEVTSMGICYIEKVEVLPNGKKRFFWSKCGLFTSAEVEVIYNASVMIGKRSSKYWG